MGASDSTKISVEISIYPLHNDYLQDIESFIVGLNQHPVKVKTNTMSTQVFGEFNSVMTAIQTELNNTFSSGRKFSVNLKIINNDLDPQSDPFNGKYID